MWTRENRKRYDRSHLRCDSDLSDAHRAEVGPSTSGSADRTAAPMFPFYSSKNSVPPTAARPVLPTVRTVIEAECLVYGVCLACDRCRRLNLLELAARGFETIALVRLPLTSRACGPQRCRV